MEMLSSVWPTQPSEHRTQEVWIMTANVKHLISMPAQPISCICFQFSYVETVFPYAQSAFTYNADLIWNFKICVLPKIHISEQLTLLATSSTSIHMNITAYVKHIIQYQHEPHQIHRVQNLPYAPSDSKGNCKKEFKLTNDRTTFNRLLHVR